MTTDQPTNPPLQPGDRVWVLSKTLHDTIGNGLMLAPVHSNGGGVFGMRLNPDMAVWQHVPEPDGDDGTAAAVVVTRQMLIVQRDEARKAAKHLVDEQIIHWTALRQALGREFDGSHAGTLDLIRELAAERDEARAKVAALEAARDALRQLILDIDAHATPYGEIPDEPGFVGTYLLTAGALHRALGKIGHTAPKCQAEEDLRRLTLAFEEYRANWQRATDATLAEVDRLKAAAAAPGAEVLEMNGTLLAKNATLQGEVDRLSAEVGSLREIRDAALWFSNSLAAGYITESVPILAAVDAYRAGQKAAAGQGAGTAVFRPARTGDTPGELVPGEDDITAEPDGDETAPAGHSDAPDLMAALKASFVRAREEREARDGQKAPTDGLASTYSHERAQEEPSDEHGDSEAPRASGGVRGDYCPGCMGPCRDESAEVDDEPLPEWGRELPEAQGEDPAIREALTAAGIMADASPVEGIRALALRMRDFGNQAGRQVQQLREAEAERWAWATKVGQVAKERDAARRKLKRAHKTLAKIREALGDGA